MTKRPAINFLALGLSIFCTALMAASNAYAACTSPSMPEGAIFYNADQNVPQLCTSKGWVALGDVNPSAGNGACSNPSMVEGTIFYNQDHGVLQFCNGTDWLAVQSASAVVGGFAGFSDLGDQALSTLVTSNILQVIIAGTSNVSISGGGSPQYRICQNTTCSVELQTWGSTASTVTEGDFIQLRLTTSASYGTPLTANVDVSGTSDEWVVTTVEDTLPISLSFTMLTSQAGSTLLQSNIVQVTGISTSVSTSITGGGSPQYRLCSDSSCSSEIQTWTSGAATVANNQYIQLRATSPASGTITVTPSVGTGSANWYVSTNGKGYFVMTSSASTGNLGGRSNANTTCVNNLTAGLWLEKASATIDAAHVFSFLCDGSGCNNLQPNTIYQFARSGAATAGGAVFVTDGTGRGPGSTGAWNTATTFNTTERYWSNRASGSTTLWATTALSNHCNNWSDGTATYSGVRGDPVEVDDGRWNDGAETCGSSRRLVCFVNP